MNTTFQDTIEKQITVRAPKERVFKAITDPEQITSWFPDKIEGKLEVGERPIFDFGECGKSQVYVTAVEPYDYFAYRWIPSGGDYPDGFIGDVLEHPNTLVEFRLRETSDGTVVRLKESGFASLPPLHGAKKFEDNSGGWDYMFDQLTKLLSKD